MEQIQQDVESLMHNQGYSEFSGGPIPEIKKKKQSGVSNFELELVKCKSCKKYMKDYKHWRSFEPELPVLVQDPAFLKFCIKTVKDLRKDIKDIMKIEGELRNNKIGLQVEIKDKPRVQI